MQSYITSALFYTSMSSSIILLHSVSLCPTWLFYWQVFQRWLQISLTDKRVSAFYLFIYLFILHPKVFTLCFPWQPS